VSLQNLQRYLQNLQRVTDLNQPLVGGFDPFEQYYSSWKSSPSRGENKKCLKPTPRRAMAYPHHFFLKHPFPRHRGPPPEVKSVFGWYVF